MTNQMKNTAERIEALKSAHDQTLIWGVRWDVSGLEVGHIFDASRVWDDGEIVEGEYLSGTSAVQDTHINRSNLADYCTVYSPTAYIVCGYHAGYGEDIGEVILSECEVMELA